MSCITCQLFWSMKIMKPPQSPPTPKPVPAKPKAVGPKVATIVLVYASHTAFTTALRSAKAGVPYASDRARVSTAAKAASILFILYPPLVVPDCPGSGLAIPFWIAMDPVCHLPMESAELYSRGAGAGAPDGKPNLRFQKPSRVSVLPVVRPQGRLVRMCLGW